MDKLFWKREGQNGYDAIFRKHEILGNDYPKSDVDAKAELVLRGLRANEDTIEYLKENCVHIGPDGWTVDDIDQAADYLDTHERWSRWAIWCWTSGVEYGQAVRAYRNYFNKKHGMPGGNYGFDPAGVKTVIHPAAEGEKYGRVEFLRGE